MDCALGQLMLKTSIHIELGFWIEGISAEKNRKKQNYGLCNFFPN